jgi:8-oxo-dGTP diphosphatase
MSQEPSRRVVIADENGAKISLPDSNRPIRVVAVVIEQQGRYLITQRPLAGKLGGLWEFPNARVLPGEADEAAIRREIRERIGVEVGLEGPKAQRTHHYVGYSVELVLYEASILPGQEPRPLKVANFRWVAPQDLEQYSFPPADQATTDQLLGLSPLPPGGTTPTETADAGAGPTR